MDVRGSWIGKRQDWLTALGVLVRKWLGGAVLIGRVNPMGTGRCRRIDSCGRHPEQEHQNWLLRGGRRWEAVAATNSYGAARARNVCVRAAK